MVTLIFHIVRSLGVMASDVTTFTSEKLIGWVAALKLKSKVFETESVAQKKKKL
jgi:hypothetical protein